MVPTSRPRSLHTARLRASAIRGRGLSAISGGLAVHRRLIRSFFFLLRSLFVVGPSTDRNDPNRSTHEPLAYSLTTWRHRSIAISYSHPIASGGGIQRCHGKGAIDMGIYNCFCHRAISAISGAVKEGDYDPAVKRRRGPSSSCCHFRPRPVKSQSCGRRHCLFGGGKSPISLLRQCRTSATHTATAAVS